MAKKKQQATLYPVAMTIAGSDSGGGAGVQADLRTFNALGVYGCSAISAITSQNPRAVTAVLEVDSATIAAQIDAVMQEIPVKFVKSGMLPNAVAIAAVAAATTKYRWNLVCDPVMVSTCGASLQQQSALQTMCEKLLPVCSWLTPNLPEAERICGRSIADLADQDAAAREISDRYGCQVVIKGGHADGDEAVDVICHRGEIFHAVSPRLELSSEVVSHGSGCTFSAALTAALALGMSWREAICEAKAFVLGSLRECVDLSRSLQAMYPPTEDSIGLIKLIPVSSARKNG